MRDIKRISLERHYTNSGNKKTRKINLSMSERIPLRLEKQSLGKRPYERKLNGESEKPKKVESQVRSSSKSNQ